VRLRHFEALRPVCPVCRGAESTSLQPLAIGSIAREEQEQIVEGILVCPSLACQREYPIVDGIPILLGSIREYIAANILALTGRSNLSEPLESLIGDCCGPGSVFDTQRQHLSSYVWDHYAEFDPAEVASDAKPSAIVRLLHAGLELASEIPSGPILDIGCGPGRTSLVLAEKCERLVLGVDLNFALLRIASRLLREGTVCYPRRRVGLAFDRREFTVPNHRTDNVDFWACDAAALPFADDSFGLAVGMNVLDSTPSPLNLLSSIERVLTPHGRTILACPYDWSAGVTPVEAWLGGHSQRSSERGASEPVLRRLLANSEPSAPLSRLQLLGEIDRFPWHVRLHDRSRVLYDVHVVAAGKHPLQ
jgi:SAM-dependent methyltransferase/uncharacterized protein YbaR (Trm112 family)